MSKILSMLLFVPVAAYAAASAPAVTNGQTEQMAVQAAVAFDGAEASVQAPVSAVTLSDDGLVLTGREMVDSYGLIRHRRIHCALRPGFCRHHPAQTVEVWRNTYQIVDRDRYVYTQKRKWEAWGAVIGAIPGLAAAAFIGAFLGAKPL
ncbi:MAG: hypothetical protein HY747_02345 [Elusimicrobia bacterium]|nr:hypothetical protein [Elusimicrobiota bacterium]